MVPASKEDAMSQSLISFKAGMAVVLFVAIFAVARNSREQSKGARSADWIRIQFRTGCVKATDRPST
jgi:hypothetical protein